MWHINMKIAMMGGAVCMTIVMKMNRNRVMWRMTRVI
jgi:hypothetical protein